MAARTANHAGHEGIEDLAAVSLSFASGLEAQLTSVWHDILTRGSTRRVEVFCRDGMVWLDDEFRGPLHVQTSDGTEVRACPSPRWVDALPLADDEVGLAVRAYVEADRAFVDAVTGGRAARAGPRRSPWSPTAWSTPPTARRPMAGVPVLRLPGGRRRRTGRGRDAAWPAPRRRMNSRVRAVILRSECGRRKAPLTRA